MTSKLNQKSIENYSKEYAKILCDEFFSKNERISGKQVLNLSNINQINLLSIRNLSNKWVSEMAHFVSPYFDYSSDEVRKTKAAFMNAVSQNISVKRSDFEPILESATHQAIVLMLDPRSFFMDKTREIGGDFGLEEVKELGKYVQINKSLVNGMMETVGTEGKMNEEEIQSYLDSLDDSAFEDAQRYITLFSSKLAFDKAEMGMPDEPVRSFFENLENHSPQEEPTENEEAELPTTSEPVAPVVEAPAIEVVEKPVPEAPQIIVPEEPVAAVVAEVEPVKTTLKVESTKNFTFKSLPVESEKLNEQFETNKSLNDVVVSEKTLHDLQAASKIEGISEGISLNQKFLFINNLFQGNRSNFDHAIEEIELCKDFFEAKELLLKKYVVKYNWNIVSHEAEEFFEIVKRRFN